MVLYLTPYFNRKFQKCFSIEKILIFVAFNMNAAYYCGNSFPILHGYLSVF